MTAEIDIERLRKALIQQCGLKPADFDPKFDIVYTASGVSAKRGGERYELPPKGWVKLALSILHRYEDTQWVRKSKWPVVYHGTSATPAAVTSIVREGFKIRGGSSRALHGERLGTGIYCSPDLPRAVRYAETPLMLDGSPFSLVFQCRIRREKYTTPEKHVWLVGNTADIRPCGILLHPYLLTDEQRIEYRGKNPYRKEEKLDDYTFYEKLRFAKTIGEARNLGRMLPHLHKDLQKGRLTLLGLVDGSLPVRRLGGFAHRQSQKKLKTRVSSGPSSIDVLRLARARAEQEMRILQENIYLAAHEGKRKRDKKEKKHKKEKKQKRRDAEDKANDKALDTLENDIFIDDP